jgi:hypothetical protein
MAFNNIARFQGMEDTRRLGALREIGRAFDCSSYASQIVEHIRYNAFHSCRSCPSRSGYITHKASMHPRTPVEYFLAPPTATMHVYETRVEAVALSYLQFGGRTPTVL